MHLVNTGTKAMEKSRIAEKEFQMVSRNEVKGQKPQISPNSSAFNVSYTTYSKTEDTSTNWCNNKTVEEILEEVKLFPPLTPITDRILPMPLEKNQLGKKSVNLSDSDSSDDDDEDDKKSRSPTSSDDSNNSNSSSEDSNLLTNDSNSSSDDEDHNSRKDFTKSFVHPTESKSLSSTPMTLSSLLPSNTVDCKMEAVTVDSSSGIRMRFKSTKPVTGMTSATVPSLSNGTAITTSSPSMPSSASSVVTTDTELTIKTEDLQVTTVVNLQTTPAAQIKKKPVPLSPESLSRLTGIEAKVIPKISFRKRTTNETSKSDSKRQKKDEAKTSSALQRAYSPQRTNNSNGWNSWTNEHENEMLGDIEENDFTYDILERTHTTKKSSQAIDSSTTLMEGQGNSSNAKENEVSDKRTKAKNIGDEWGSMVSKPNDPTEEFSYGNRWSRQTHNVPTPVSRRHSVNNRRRRRGWDDDHRENQSDRERARETRRRRERDGSRESKRTKLQTENISTQTEEDVTNSEMKKENDDVVVKDNFSQTSSTILTICLNDKLETSKSYRTKALALKEIGDTMDDGLGKMVTYTKVIVIFIEEAYALEKEQKSKEQKDLSEISAKLNDLVEFSKANSEIMKSQMTPDEDPNKSWTVLSVLNLRIQSYIYNRIYTIRRIEVCGAKLIMDEFVMGNNLSPSGSNISDGGSSATRSKEEGEKSFREVATMNGREFHSMQFYMKYMENVAKSISYAERAEIAIKSSRRVGEFYSGMSLEFGELHIDSPFQFFVRYSLEVIRRLSKRSINK